MTSDNKLEPDPLTNGGVISVHVLGAIVTLALGTVVAAVTMAVLLPDQTPTVALLLAFVTPIIAAMISLAVGQRQLHKDVNSRLSELVAATGAAAHAQGVTDERAGVTPPTTPEIKATEAKPC